jgi:hypothetical protein
MVSEKQSLNGFNEMIERHKKDDFSVLPAKFCLSVSDWWGSSRSSGTYIFCYRYGSRFMRLQVKNSVSTIMVE